MISSDPLFSSIVTFCTLIFFYLPDFFSKIVFSPVIILTGVLLLTILRLGAIQKIQNEQKENQQKDDESVKQENRARKCREEKEKQSSIKSLDRMQRLENEANSEMGLEKSSCFVEWNVRAPLEVIYEEYEDEEKWDDANEREENWNMGVSNYASLNHYFPESDSDSSSESGSPTIEEWDEEDGEGLIEIALDGRKRMKMDLEFQYEEENLIEIDIFPTRYGELSDDTYR